MSEPSPMMCVHANEVPVYHCPCRQDCYCRSNTCKGQPKYGDTQEVVCSWCRRHTITEVFRQYPKATGIPGGYWDCSACSCGSMNGMIAAGNAMLKMGRERKHPVGWHKSTPVSFNR